MNMKTHQLLNLKLTDGSTATFFLNSAQNLVVLANSSNAQHCTLVDGLHNNGGWKIAEPASAVIKKLKDLMVH